MSEIPVESVKLNSTDYAYASGVVQVLASKLVSFETLIQMAESKDLHSARQLLADTEYADQKLDYQNLLASILPQMKALHAKLAPDDQLTGTVFLMKDFENLKYLLKSLILRKDPVEDEMYLGWSAQDQLVSLVYEQPIKVADQLFQVYLDAIKDGLSLYERWGDPAVIDYHLSQVCFRYLLALGRFRKAKLAVRYVQAWSDLENIQTLLRWIIRRKTTGWQGKPELMRLAFLPTGTISSTHFSNLIDEDETEAMIFLQKTKYGKLLAEPLESLLDAGNWGALERVAEEVKMKVLREARLVACGFEPVFAYFWAKENECRQIQLVLKGKAFNLKPEEIRERLWSTYV